MEGRLPPVHFGASVVHRRDDRPEGEAKTLAVLAAYSHDRNGRVLHPDDYSLLCGQRAKPTAVAGIASACLLDSADAHRRADPYQCVASSSACEKSPIVKEIGDREPPIEPDALQRMTARCVGLGAPPSGRRFGRF